jgi:hypothetical protein
MPLILLLLSCVDPIEFEVPPAQSQLVVEGLITDAPGPYRVRLTRAMSVGNEIPIPKLVPRARITLFDDEGNSEDFADAGNGEYLTGGVITGQVGHRYYIKIVTDDGNTFESEPDLLTPVGTVKEIRYEFEERAQVLEYGEFRGDVFNVYIDSEAGTTDETFVRWKLTGTYEVLTTPHLHRTWLQGELWFATPLPCSGYVVVPALGGGGLEQRAACTCCTCWANEYEVSPQISDNSMISGSEFKNVKIGEVTINSATFFKKYLVLVQQMSLSRTAFDFFSLIKGQKEGVLSLFQPPSAEIRGNVKPVGNTNAVVGLFYASSISQKSLFITPDKVPYVLPPIDFSWSECYNYYRNASTTRPALWED